jgi:hypothetical protein
MAYVLNDKGFIEDLDKKIRELGVGLFSVFINHPLV